MTTNAMYYEQGQWGTGADVMIDAWREGEDITEVLKRLGYALFTTVGYGAFPAGLGIAVYQREQSPAFLIEVEGSGDRSHHIYTETLPDVLELLARWTPIAQAGAVAMLTRALSEADLGLVRDSAGLARALQAALGVIT